MSELVLDKLNEKIEKSIESLKSELNTVRAGRANPALLDRVEVEYYGVPTPLKQLANISCPDPRTIAVTPFDPKGSATSSAPFWLPTSASTPSTTARWSACPSRRSPKREEKN